MGILTQIRWTFIFRVQILQYLYIQAHVSNCVCTILYIILNLRRLESANHEHEAVHSSMNERQARTLFEELPPIFV